MNFYRTLMYGYSKLADISTALALKYLKMPVDEIPQPIIIDANAIDDVLADKVWDYMFVGQPRERDENVWKFRYNNVKRIWKERWKYREIYDLGALAFLLLKIRGVVFHEGDQ